MIRDQTSLSRKTKDFVRAEQNEYVLRMKVYGHLVYFTPIC